MWQGLGVGVADSMISVNLSQVTKAKEATKS